ncbi:MAG: hypothetical protein MI863_00870 [Desulfobacterales bacterium]|nr:hypothetical protein [Desulfobacterales bacterium]
MFDQYIARRYRTDIRPDPESYLLKDKTAVVGIGQTEFSKNSGRSTLQLACEAIKNAVDDAGLEISDIDGIVKYTMDPNDEPTLMDTLGIKELKFYGELPHGGGACTPTLMHGAMAVATGAADCVVCFRALNQRSDMRYGRTGMTMAAMQKPMARNSNDSLISPYGLTSPISWVAMYARRYMHLYGATREHLGWVAINNRRHAVNNPDALFYEKPMTMDDYLNSKMIVEPFCLLDSCVDVDGACAVVITSAERAKDLKQTPAYIVAATQGTAENGEMMTSYYRPRMERLPEVWYAGQELWRVSGLEPKDVDVCQIYDAFSVLVPAQLEEYGFCGEGEGPDFCWGGERTGVDGELPLNTSGSLMSEGYIHGMNLITEAVRQIRGTSVNQVKDVEISMSTAGLGVPTGAIIFRR